ncbi:MAG: hypothetical protein JSU81_04560 [Candidatus Coatesbacteria bacterium]|nr:MAG: hypothetical protein JSU81_04560 [Candidatus Coatesbacteria bacterium]
MKWTFRNLRRGIVAAGVLAVPVGAAWVFDVEAGAAFAGYNDVRVPNDGGTDLSLTEDLAADPAAYYRLRGWFRIGDRHAVGLLGAPLRLRSTGSVPRSVWFDGVEFAPGTPLTAKYRFDSYRLTYRYDLLRRPALVFGLGGTAKVRDASITLEGGGRRAETSNTGPVPLVNFALAWSLTERWTFQVEGDALVGPQGRAEDVFAGFAYSLRDTLALRSGYRVLEGGADVGQVYNFALVHFVGVGVTVTL